MQDIINEGYINSAFLQYMRTISADKDLASFLFAGTYDIKKLIHDSKYNISGAFTYLREPDKPLFEISSEAAEELINMMQGQLDFSPAAMREIHRLTGDVPFWIQKICLNCAFYGVLAKFQLYRFTSSFIFLYLFVYPRMYSAPH